MSANRKVLVVDDDCMMVRTLCHILNIMGYETETAGTGEEAMEKARSARPCCVLMDIRMPRLDGIGALKIIRQSMPDLPVLLMGAQMTEEQTEEAERHGVNAVFRKPLDMREVLSCLSRLIEENNPPDGGRPDKPVPVPGETEGVMGTEGRKFLRVPVDETIEIRRVAEAMRGGPASTGKCRDISVGGIGFLCEICFPLGTRIEIGIQIEGTVFAAKAEVVRARSIGGEYDHGARFLPDDAETAKMLEELALL